MIGWEIFADPPRYMRQVAKGSAETYDQAKVEATAAHSALVANQTRGGLGEGDHTDADGFARQRTAHSDASHRSESRGIGSVVQVIIDPEVLKELEYIVTLHREHDAPNPMENVEQLIAYVLASVAAGSRRPGAWERQIVEMLGLVAECDDHQLSRQQCGPPTVSQSSQVGDR